MAEWFYQFNGVNEGPVNDEDLRQIFESGALPLSTPVWCEGMNDWAEAGTIPGIAELMIQETFEKSRTSKFSRSVKWAVVLCACAGLSGLGLWEFKRMKTLSSGSDNAHQKPINERQQAAVLIPEKTNSEPVKPANENLAEQKKDATLPPVNPLPPLSQSPEQPEENQSLNQMLLRVNNVNDQSMTSRGGFFSREYIGTVTWIKVEGQRSGTGLANFPTPQKGNPAKVSELITYIQEKLNNVNSGRVFLGYNSNRKLWHLNCPMQGYLFDMADLDPTSAQIVSTMHGAYTDYTIRFSTRNSKKRIIIYNKYGNVVWVQSYFNIPCGSGPGEYDARKIGQAMSALVYAYGGTEEFPN